MSSNHHNQRLLRLVFLSGCAADLGVRGGLPAVLDDVLRPEVEACAAFRGAVPARVEARRGFSLAGLLDAERLFPAREDDPLDCVNLSYPFC